MPLALVTTKTANHPKPSGPPETIRNHPKLSKTIRNDSKLLATNHKLPGISYNQPQTTINPQQPVAFG